VRLPALAISVVLVGLAAWALTTTASSAPAERAPHEASTPSAGVEPKQCHAARRAVVYYRGKTWQWQERRPWIGYADRKPTIRGRDCRFVRYALGEWRARARAARVNYDRWYRFHFDWKAWLPSKWQRIGACETGYGERPGNWTHNSGTYQGAFGFRYTSWDDFVPRAARAAGPYPSEAHFATPRQQYEVALAIYRRYGFSGWGCRGA
jgi:hypothetical protein